MKITKKRIAIGFAAAAVLTSGVFGGTFAKYVMTADTKTDTARVAKFYLEAEPVNLFSTEYTNDTGTGTDIKSLDVSKVIAPNFTSSATLSLTYTTEVKSVLSLNSQTTVIDTNLPEAIQKEITVEIGTDGTIYNGTLHDLMAILKTAKSSSNDIKIADVAAATNAQTTDFPVTVTWPLNNGIDQTETDAAVAQYTADSDYKLTITAGATLTQVD